MRVLPAAKGHPRASSGEGRKAPPTPGAGSSLAEARRLPVSTESIFCAFSADHGA